MNNTDGKAEEKKVSSIIFKGMSKERIVVTNELLFKLDENKKINQKAVEYFEGNLDRLNIEYWFISLSKCKNKDEKVKYNAYKKQQLESTKKSIEQMERQIKAQTALLDKINSFLEMWNKHVELTKSTNSETNETERIATYDKDFFDPLIEFALNIGYLDYDYEITKKKIE